MVVHLNPKYVYVQEDVAYNEPMQTNLPLESDSDLVTELALKFNLKTEQAENLAEWLRGGDGLEGDVEEAVYSFYLDSGEMPYGVAKARTGDPQEWINEQLKREFDL
jgi:hypothetical protein